MCDNVGAHPTECTLFHVVPRFRRHEGCTLQSVCQPEKNERAVSCPLPNHSARQLRNWKTFTAWYMIRTMSQQIKTPSAETLAFITKNYAYDSVSGIISNARTGRRLGHRSKRNNTIRISAKFGRISAHQIAWYLTYSEWPARLIDHIDGNPANNRIDNLRLATNTQNGLNSRKWAKKTTSQYKGVSWYERDKKWTAAYRHAFLGYFVSESEAALAYDAAALAHDPTFACLNFGDALDRLESREGKQERYFLVPLCG